MAEFSPDGQMLTVWHIRAGATFKKEYQWKVGDPAVGVDLTGWEARAHIRVKAEDAAIVLALSTVTGGITVNSQGYIEVTIEPVDTMLVQAAGKKLVFDLELERISDGFVRNLVGGTVATYPNVTRE